jgi:foldase protein PrsA
LNRSKRAAQKTADSKQKRSPGGNSAQKTRRAILPAVAVILIIGAIAGFAIYRDRMKPFNAIVLEVDGSSINMRYFLKRVAMSGEPSLTTLQALTKEEIIKQSVTKPPYDITVTEQEIDRYAREIARGKNKTIEDKEFQEWYRQQLNESRLSDAEFKDLLRTRLLGLRMREYLADRVPTVAEQVFVHMFPLKDFATGQEVKQKLDAGQDFAALARLYSVDSKLKDSGGVVGWIPRGVLDPGFDNVAFELEVGRSSDPMYIGKHTVVVIMISDKVAAREIDAALLDVIKSKALDNWLKEERQYHKVKYRGFKNGYDTETDAWVQWQLQRMKQ